MKLAYTLPLIITSLFSQTPSETALELYTNAAFLKQRFDVGSGNFSANVPSFTSLENLQIKSTCNINKKELKNEEEIDDELQTEINNIKNIKKDLLQQKEVILSKKELLKTLSLEKISINEVNDTAQAFGTLILSNLKEEAALEEEIKEVTLKLNELLNKRSNFKTKTLHVELSCNAPSNLEIAYDVPNVKVERISKFDAETDEEMLTLSQIAYISHSLGTNLNNILIRLYSFSYNQSITPSPFYPYYVDMPRQRNIQSNALKQKAMLQAPMQEVAMVSDAFEKQLSTKRVWEASGINLPSGQKNEVTFNKQQLPFTITNEIDGYASSSAFAKLSFTPRDTIESGYASFVLDGTLLGQRYIQREDKNNQTHLFFGKNELIQVSKELQKDFTDDSILSNNQTTQKLWKYTIKNHSNKKESISLKERLPLSKHENIIIKPLGDKADSISVKGEVLWSFELKANEKKEIVYGYSIKKPNIK